MKVIKQFTIIILFTVLGTVISNVLQIGIPGSVIGIVLLFLALYFNIVKVDDIDDVAVWLTSNMAIMFVPPAVNILAMWDVLKVSWFSLTIITIISTILTMAITALISEKIVGK